MKALEFPSDFMEIKDAPPIILNVFDEDPGYFDADDYLGRAEIFLKDAQYCLGWLKTNLRVCY